MLAFRTRALPLRAWTAAQRRYLATPTAMPQTYVEKIVQRHAVGLPEGAVVKAGDYVMIKPQHVMTHASLYRQVITHKLTLGHQDNTGPVISKFVSPSPRSCSPSYCADMLPASDSSRSEPAKSPILVRQSSRWTTTCRIARRPTSPSTLGSKRSPDNMMSTSTPLDEVSDIRS